MDMKVKISITDTELYKDILNLLREILEDENINKSTKDKYFNKLQNIISLNNDLA